MKMTGRRKSEKGSGHRRRLRSSSAGAWKVIYVFIFILLLVDGFFAYSLVERAGRNPAAAKPAVPEPVSETVGQTIRVEVLNGSGKGGVAKEMTDYLRARGFDVIDYGNAENQSFYETIVLDRTGDRILAEHLARVIGARQVVQQKNPYLALDVTLIMGRDYEQLIPFAQERRPE